MSENESQLSHTRAGETLVPIDMSPEDFKEVTGEFADTSAAPKGLPAPRQ